MDQRTELGEMAPVPPTVQWVDPPHGFVPKGMDEKPWKPGTMFVIDGMLWQVYEMKRAKPHSRALVRLLKIAVAVPTDPQAVERAIPVTEQVTPREEFDNESYTPPPEP